MIMYLVIKTITVTIILLRHKTLHNAIKPDQVMIKNTTRNIL